MASTATRNTQVSAQQPVRRIVVDIVSHTDGTVSNTIDLNGTILRVQAKPDSINPPSNLYDLSITDPGGSDILAGGGQNLSNVTTKNYCPLVSATDGTTATVVPIATDGLHTITGSGWGSATVMQLIFYMR